MTEQTTSLLRQPDFRRLWSSQTVSSLGTQVTVVALPMVALTRLHAGALQTSLLAAFEFLPFLLIGLPAGVWLDRRPIRPVLVLADLARAVALGVLPLAAWLGFLSLPLVYAAVLVVGAGTVFSDIGHQSLLPTLIAEDRLGDGNGKLQGSQSMSQLAGPALGGLLTGLFSAPVAVLADSLSYLASAGLLSRIRAAEPQPAADRADRSLRREIGEGLRFVFGTPTLRALMLCTALANLAFGGVLAVVVLYGTRGLHLSSTLVGVALAIGNAGGLLAMVCCEPVRKRFGYGGLMLAGVVVFNAGAWLLPLDGGLPVFALALFVTFLGIMSYNVGQVTIRQIITPRQLLGRMNATMRFVMWGTVPLGAALAGLVAQGWSLRGYLWVAAALNATAVLPLLLTPSVLREPGPAVPVASETPVESEEEARAS
jgi:MFS family permease